MHGEHVAAAQVQPGQHEHLVALPQAACGLAELGEEDDSCPRRSLVALLRGGGAIGERRLDPADRPQFVRRIGQLVDLLARARSVLATGSLRSCVGCARLSRYSLLRVDTESNTLTDDVMV